MTRSKISANYVVGPNFEFIKNGIIELNEEGVITKLSAPDKSLKEQSNFEYYPGILVPGFVNTHCHLELSHLKNTIPENTGMIGFLREINSLRNISEEDIYRKASNADRIMYETGTVACGDISNRMDTLEIKKASPIFYHTFVEVFGFLPERAQRAFGFAQKTYDAFIHQGLSASIVPHAPYSMSKNLFRLVANHARENCNLLSFHYQESAHENDLLEKGTGAFIDHFRDFMKFDLSGFQADGCTATVSCLSQIPVEKELLLVHNLTITQDDINWIKANRNLLKTNFVLCPNSNLYIHNTLPDIDLLNDNDLIISVGTDSLASNKSLSMLEEMKTLQNRFPSLGFSEILKWSTINGAKALNIENWAGKIEVGKKPGINLIFPFNFKEMKLTNDSFAKKII